MDWGILYAAGLAGFTASLAAGLTGLALAPGAALRLLRGLVAGYVHSSPLAAAAAALGTVLHASLAAVAVIHSALLAALLGLPVPGALASATALAALRLASWLAAFSAAGLLAVRLATGLRQPRCVAVTVLAGAAAAAGAAGLPVLLHASLGLAAMLAAAAGYRHLLAPRRVLAAKLLEA